MLKIFRKDLTMLNNFKEAFLNPKELQAELGIDIQKQAVLRMRKNQLKTNALPFYKIGKKILYKRKEILEWIENQKIKGGENE